MSNSTSTSAAPASPPGRSLRKSVLVGLLLGGLFLASILVYEQLFVLLAAVAAAAGAWELATAMRGQGWRIPRVPIVLGSLAILPATYLGGAVAQWFGAMATVLALAIWRIGEVFGRGGRDSRQLRTLARDIAASVFVVIYLPLMTSFSVLMLHEFHNDGHYWVLVYVTTVAFIDTAGYLVGRKFGRHQMAPGVSPKKSWEGLLASMVAGSAVAIVGSILLDRPTWFAFIFAGAMLLAAVFGDLAESLIKRDLGIKDMSSLLPGHGGVMDRLDSILPATLIAYLLVSIPL